MDTFLSVALALLALVMTYLGVHMALHEPPESAKGRYKWAFIGLGLLSVVLIGIQAWRNSESQAQNVKLLEDIKRQGEINQRLGETNQRQGEQIALQQAELKGIGLRPIVLPTPSPTAAIRFVQRQTSLEGGWYGYLVTYISERPLVTPILEIRFSGPIHDFDLGAVTSITDRHRWITWVNDRTIRATVMRSFEANAQLTFSYSAAKPTKVVSVTLLD